MKIFGVQNFANITNGNFNTVTPQKNNVKQEQIGCYNPVYYMPAFKSSNKDKFINLFEKGLKTEPSQKELEQLYYYLNELERDVVFDKDSFIGDGTFGSVYRINDDYVLKVEHPYYGARTRKFNYAKYNKFNNIPYYYGGILATCDNLSIMKNADPKGTSITSGEPMWLDDAEKTEYLVNKSLPAFAKLPQSSYNNFALVLKKLNEMPFEVKDERRRMSPDTCNSNNFMIVDNEIRFVDELFTLYDDTKNDLYTMCIPFLNHTTVLADPKKNSETINNKREIFKKCILAAEEAELPLPTTIQNSFGNIMSICDYKTNVKEFLNFVDSTRKQEFDKNIRKQKIADYLDNLN